MIGRRDLPDTYLAWNKRWNAPFGRKWPLGRLLRGTTMATKWIGPFGYQQNAETREFEYPWAYSKLKSAMPLNIVEIGGGLSGLQFLLGADGHTITNADPGATEQTGDWGFRVADHTYLASVFGGPVKLIPRPLEESGLPASSADRVLCVSVIEHLSPSASHACMTAVRSLLKPNGLAVFTVDLFLDLHPFSSVVEGRWGRNANVRQLIESAGLELVEGDRAELFGFPEFAVEEISRRKHSYLVSSAGSVAQCLVLRRSGV